MKLSKEEIERIALGLDRLLIKKPDSILLMDFRSCLDTMHALHAGINTLADQYESQGRIAEAKELRRLGE